jgi:WD40 repeat protein
MMRLMLFVLCWIGLFTVTVAAQDGYPLPDDLAPIASDNALRLQQLESVGSLLQGQLLWSPDGTTLVVGTSADTRMYNAADFSAAPIIIHDAPRIGSVSNFNTDGELVINGQRWDVQTGELLGAVPPPIVPTVDTNNQITVEVLADDEQTILELTKLDGEVSILQIESPFEYKEIQYNLDYTYAAVILGDEMYSSELQLWNLGNSHLVFRTTLLENLDTLMFRGDIVVIASYYHDPYSGTSQAIEIWNATTGQQLSYSQYLPIYYSPNNELIAFLAGPGIALWSDRELGVLAPKQGLWEGEGMPPPILFSPDGNTLVSKAGNQLLFWDVNIEEVSTEPSRVIAAEATIYSIFYSQDGSRLITVEASGTIEVWDAATGERQARIQSVAYSSSVQISRDSNLIKAPTNSIEIGLWNIRTGGLEKSFPAETAFNADWSIGAYWETGIVRIVYRDSRPNIELTIIPDYMGQTGEFNSNLGWIMFPYDGVQIYDVTTGEQVFSHSNSRASFSGDGRHLVFNEQVGDNNNDVIIRLTIVPVSNLQQIVASYEILSRGRLLSPNTQFLSKIRPSGCMGNGWHELLNADQQRIQLPTFGRCGPLSHVFSPDGQWLIVLRDTGISTMNIRAAFEEGLASETHLLRSDSESIRYIQYDTHNYPTYVTPEFKFSPDSSLLTVLGSDYQLTEDGSEGYLLHFIDVWRFNTLTTLNDIPPEPLMTIPDATQAVFSPDSKYVATNLGLWNLATGEQVAAFDSSASAFNHDGTLLATYSENTVTLWDVTVLEHGHGDAALVTLNIADVQELAFNLDNTLLYIKRTGDVQVWGIPPR